MYPYHATANYGGSIGIDDALPSRNPTASRQEIERQTLEYMATMPGWRDHPHVMANRASPES
jgi:hypothetical protein